MNRRAIRLLLATVAISATPLAAQDAPVTEPTASEAVVPVPDPVPQPTASQPTPQPVEPVATTPPPARTTSAPAAEPAAKQSRAATRTTRTAARAPAAPRSRAPVREAAPAAAAPVAAPTAEPVAPAAAPVAAPPPVAAPVPVPEQPAEAGPAIWMWLVGGGLILLLGFAAFNMFRHRRKADEFAEVYDEAPVRDVYEEPAPVMAAPAAAVGAGLIADRPLHPRETVSTPMGDVITPDEFAPADDGDGVAVAHESVVAKADSADAEALTAASVAPDGRPWLEFLMRPVRAGTSKDAAVVEFELTVGNTGTLPARDVRISTFMFAAGSAQESEMERMLIDPPADSTLAEVEIAAGDATKVEATMALSRVTLAEQPVLPVVVADARYRLPDGSEGRTRAAFEVGMPGVDGLDPFPTDRTSGLLESVEARLHGEPERV